MNIRAWLVSVAPRRLKQAYPTPKVDVRGAVFRDGEVLLVREEADGRWTLPGGWADVGESPSRAVEREVREESGYTVRAVKLAGVFDLDRLRNGRPLRPNVYKLFFVCELAEEHPAEIVGFETSAARFFASDAVPELSVPRVTREQLERMWEHARDPARPADFD
jgi:ADP-ribose pyrophosphatase YjhB (NUDIX family)